MLWTEIALDKFIKDGVLRQAAAHALGISSQSVVVTDILTPDSPEPWGRPGTQVVLKSYVQAGDYSLNLSFIVGDPQLAAYKSQGVGK